MRFWLPGLIPMALFLWTLWPIPMDLFLFLCYYSYGPMAYSYAILAAGACSYGPIPMDLMVMNPYGLFLCDYGLFLCDYGLFL